MKKRLNLIIIFLLSAFLLISPAFWSFGYNDSVSTNGKHHKKLYFKSPKKSTFKSEKEFYENGLKVVFFNVGHGDAILVITPNKKTLLVDGGIGANEYIDFDAGQKVIAPYLKYNHIYSLNGIVLTHPHDDHLGGLIYIMEHFKIFHVYDSGSVNKTLIYSKYLNLIKEKKLKHTVVKRGDQIPLDENIQIKVLFPEKQWLKSKDLNETSVVLKIIYDQVSFLLTGDITRDVEDYLVSEKSDIKSTVLKVPHHGLHVSSSDFIEAVAPEVVIFSMGKKHEANLLESVMAGYMDIAAEIYRTDQNGRIEITTDGQYYSVKCRKNKFSTYFDWNKKWTD